MNVQAKKDIWRQTFIVIILAIIAGIIGAGFTIKLADESNRTHVQGEGDPSYLGGLAGEK